MISPHFNTKVMGWGTFFNADIYIDRESYENIYQVNEDIEITEKDIQGVRERLMMYCASGCDGVYSKDCEDNPINPIDALHSELVDLLNYYDELQQKLCYLYLLKEDWDEKEGKFKTVEVG